MNELQIFNNEEFGNVRSLMIDNEPWLVTSGTKTVVEILTDMLMKKIDEK